jgi:hypothetical protein
LTVNAPDQGMHLVAFARRGLSDVAIERAGRQNGVVVRAAACYALTGNIDRSNIMPWKSFASCMSSQFRAMRQRSRTGFQSTENI